MKNLLIILAVSLITGCSTVREWIPSFWDDNQSAMIVEARLDIDSIDCSKDQHSQVSQISRDLRRFELYSQSKGSLQQDVLKLIQPIQLTVSDWSKRVNEGSASQGYCLIKKRILQQQIDRASSAVLGRW